MGKINGMINYDGKVFSAVSNTMNGETSQETIFHYHQSGIVLTAEYKGGKILVGHLIGKVDKDGYIDMRYHHINLEHQLHTGRCRSRPEILSDGRIRLHEEWQWTSGDLSSGKSIIEEFPADPSNV